MDVEAWLAGLGLDRYAAAFRANDVDREVLLELSEADLERLGVASLGHRKRLLAAIAALAREPAEAADPPTADRRPVAVLFCDLVGFTRLAASRDPEEVHALLERFFATADRVVVEHGGTVDKHIGDCVMGLFGAPRAHGDDVDRAVRAAQALQAEVDSLAGPADPPLATHIGLAVGEVVAGPTGSDAHRAYTVTGDAVNLAARLADRAGPGEIWAAEAVRRAARGGFAFTEIGELALDGIDRPVRAVRIGPRPAEPIPAPAGTFVGRSAELAQLRGLIAACQADGAGRTVLLRGEAGIGKSRLLRELVAGAAGFQSHEALVLDFGAGSGAGAGRELAQSLLGLAPAAAPEERLAAAERAIGDGAVEPALRTHLLDLLGLPLPAELAALRAAMDEKARSAFCGRALAALLRSAARLRPRLVLVEDLHWADAGTLAELAALASVVGECPALLLLTTRPEGDPLERGWRTLAPDAPLVAIELAPLGPAEARALALDLLRAEADAAARCVARSAGNPLFLEQLARAEVEQRRDSVPETIQSLVLARVDGLPARERELLRAAAVLGQRFELEPLRAVAGDPAAECGELVRRGLVRPHGAGFLFAHALIRDSVYRSLLHGQRRALHGRAAAWHETGDPLLHAEHLELAADPRAAAALLRAARAEAARARLAAARELLARAEPLAAEPGLRCAIAREAGGLLVELGEPAAGLEAFERALAAAADEPARARARLGLASCLRLVDRLDEARALVDTVEAAARAAGDGELLARALHLRGNLLFPLGRVAECRAAHEAALAAAEAAGSTELRALALGGLGDAFYLEGRLLSACDAFARCVALASAERLAGIALANQPMLAILQYFVGEPEAARANARAAFEAAGLTGRPRAELIARHAAFLVAEAAARLEEAEAHLDRAEAVTAALGARRFVPENQAFRARLRLRAGDRPGARELLARALAGCRAGGMAFVGPVVLGGIVAVSDDPAERAAAIAEASALLDAGSACHNHLLFSEAAIEGCLAASEDDAALSLADRLETWLGAEATAWAAVQIERARAVVARRRLGPEPAILDRLARLAAEAGRIGLARLARELGALAEAPRAGDAPRAPPFPEVP